MARYRDHSNKKYELSTVGEAMQELLNVYRLRPRFQEARLTASWESIMGKSIAKRTDKVFINDRVLYIKLNSAPLRNELSMCKSKLMGKFIEEFGEVIVDDIKFL
jgi:predicted nucleic acid-binding Zn ribbon protein